MKKTTFSILASLLICFGSFSQDCNLIYKDGAKIKLLIKSWTNPLMGDMKFLKQKDEKRDEQIIKYNSDVAAGKIPPTSTYPLSYTVSKAVIPAGDEYRLGVNIAGKDYFSFVVCKNDT